MSMFVKLSAARGIPVIEIVAARAIISVVLSYLMVRRIKTPLFCHNKKLLIARGLVGTMALSMVYYSITQLPLAVATVIQFLNPVFAALLGLWLLKEYIRASLIWCIALSLIGVSIMTLAPSLGSSVLNAQALESAQFPPVAVAMGLGGAFLSGLAYIVVRKLSLTEEPAVIVFYFPLVALPIALPFVIIDFVMPDALTLVYLGLVGCFTQVGQIYITKAMKLENAGKVAAYGYTQIVFATLLGVFFLTEIPTVHTLIGTGLIIVGAFINMKSKS